MENGTKLIIVKAAHTGVWLIMAMATMYILYAGITRTINVAVWASIGLLSLESLVLVANKWTCPLSPVAMRYTSDRVDNFDIYLPRSLARYNKLIFGTMFAVGLLLVIFNALAS